MTNLVNPRNPRGFRDSLALDVRARRQMIETILGVYERYGFEPLETPALEYVDVLGKYLPESDTPEGGVFALRDDDGNWVAMRYDLTAPLSRVVAQYGNDLASPYRRYQVGPVWRLEKPGPGRFREFYQCDFDTVGTASIAADAEVCAVLASCMEAVGINRGNYVVKVNNRKVLNGVLDAIGLPANTAGEGDDLRLTVLRAIDKLDRLGEKGVEQLLGAGRRDESGDFTKGAGLSEAQVEVVMGYVRAGGGERAVVTQRLRELIGSGSTAGEEGIRELEGIAELLASMGLGEDQVVFDPTVVRGLAYYTGPVFEAALTFEVEGDEGERQPFGSVAGGGRYDDLVKRFTGTDIPATGASIGVDRLLAALRSLDRLGSHVARGPVVVTVFDQTHLTEYQRMVSELRSAGIAAELYLGTGGFRAQLKYADKRDAPVAVIAGEDEFGRGEVTLKDMLLGSQLAAKIQDREAWKEQPAQVSVPRQDLVAEVRKLIERHRQG